MKEKVLRHYDRMITWVEQQPADEVVSSVDMRLSLGEAWFWDDCIYCYEYSCRGCPLYTEDNGCCDGFWITLNCSCTWGDWLYWANRTREYINDNG